MSNPRYKAHYGKSQPVADDVMVEVVLFDSEFDVYDIERVRSKFVEWSDELYPIIAYRILEDEQ